MQGEHALRSGERPNWAEVEPSHRTLEQEAGYLVTAAATAGLAVRMMGGVGIYHTLGGSARERYEQVRDCPHDIDLLTRPKTSDDLKQLFTSLGYVADERFIAWHGEVRHRYFHLDESGQPRLEVDVFLGKPPLCHEIDFMDGLDVPGLAMGPTDLLLQKLQIHAATAKDLIDAAFLFAEFPVVESGEGIEVIAAPRIAELLANDWGFHKTATTNLERIQEAVGAALDGEDAERASARVRDLARVIDETPKTRRWKLRAKIGTRVRWYEEVEEVLR